MANQSVCLCSPLWSTHRAADVSLHQPFCEQLLPEAAAELHQLLDGETGRQSLVLLHHGPARMLQDQQTDVPESEEVEQSEGRKRSVRGDLSLSLQRLSHFTTRRQCSSGDEIRKMRRKCQREGKDGGKRTTHLPSLSGLMRMLK